MQEVIERFLTNLCFLLIVSNLEMLEMGEELLKLNKDNLHELLLTFYKETKDEARSVGLRKANLVANSIYGFTLLLLFFTTIMINRERLSDTASILVLTLFAVIMFSFFVFFIIYVSYLHKVESTHHLTGLKIEGLIFDIIYNNKEKDQVEKEIKDLFPHTRCVDKLGIYRKRFFQKNVHRQNEDKIMRRFFK